MARSKPLASFISRRAARAPRLTALAALVMALFAGGPTACVYSVEDDVSITAAPDDDKEYAAALDKATQERTVFKEFETRYRVTATYLSPEFRTAFTQRLERVFKRDEVRFEEADQKAGFFVSIHAPNEDRTDLSNTQHWTILLNAKDGPMKPMLVKKLSDKERWRAFFHSVTEWTTEYLVVFDAPAVNPNSPALVEKSHVSLTFANADAQVNLIW